MNLKTLYSWSFILLLLTSGNTLKAEDPLFSGMDDGLMHNMVNSFLTDHQGFMWIATEDGLHRFDGYEFKVFQPAPKMGYPNQSLTLLFEDKNRNIWLSNQIKGLLKFDPTSEKFTPYPFSQNEATPTFMVTEYDELRNQIWVAKEKGLFLYNRQADSFTKILWDEHYNKATVNVLKADSRGNVWIGTTNGLIVYSAEEETFYSYFTDPNDWSTVSMNHILSLAIDYHGTLWAGTMWGINRVITGNDNDLQTVRFERIIPSDTSNQYNFIYSITPHPSGALWLRTQRCIYEFTGHNNGNYKFINHWEYSITGRNLSAFLSPPVFDSQNNLYFIYNGQPRQIIWFDQEDQQIKTLKIDIEPYLDEENAFMLRKIFIDSSDVLWAAVEKRGFFRYDLKKQPFEIMLPGKDVYGIFKTPEGKLFAGSRTGLNIFDPATSKWSLITPENNNTMIWQFPGTLSLASRNQLRIGFWDGLAGIYNIDNNTFTNFEYRFDDSTSLSTWSVREIFEDNNNDIWLGGTDNGLALMAGSEGVFQYFQNYPNPERNYPEQGALSISQDASGNLLIGSRINGLIRFNLTDSVFEQVIPSHQHSFLWPTEVSQIYRESPKTFWLATSRAGLVRYNSETNEMVSFGKTNGFHTETIQSVTGDNQNNLWLGTMHGLIFFNTQTREARNFFVTDGLPSNEFNTAACFKDENGKLYFGTTGGLVSFHPYEITIKDFNPAIALTSLHIFNEQVKTDSLYNGLKILTKSINYTDTLVFNHKHQMISIGFAAFHYSEPEKINYHYKLEGFDEDWREAPAHSRRATYTNLPPGDYTFRVKAINHDGQQSNTTKALQIKVLTPWFQSFWFRMAIALVIIILFITFYLARLASLKKQKINLEKTVLARTSELREANENLLKQSEKISAQKNMLEKQAGQLKEADYIKTKFFINISHELRTPLTLILSPIDSLIKKAKKPSQTKLFVMMQKNSLRLLHLIDQLLDIRKIESGNKTIELSQGNIKIFVKNILDMFRNMAHEKKIKLNFIDKELTNPVIWFDHDLLDKILHNLLSNAIKYTPFNEQVVVEIKPDKDQYIEIFIINTGIGISEEAKKDVFQRFYHYDPRKENIGYGIGLSYVKDLVDIYHGSIAVASEKNDYTLFSVKLPVLPQLVPNATITENATPVNEPVFLSQEIESPDEEELPDNKNTKEEKPLVLIVEDNPDLLDYLASELESHYKIKKAENGLQGLKQAQKRITDLIISDVMMPEMDGTELCRQLKTDIRTSHIPVILLTAKVNPADQVEGLSTGADDYITKPFNIDVLKAKISSLLQNRLLLANSILSPSALKKPAVSEIDSAFLENCKTIVKENIFNPEFGYEQFYNHLNISKSNGYRKIKGLTGKSPGEYILIEKMKLAAELLAAKKYQPTQIAYEMGYNNPSNFTRDFKKVFKKTPREFL